MANRADAASTASAADASYVYRSAAICGPFWCTPSNGRSITTNAAAAAASAGVRRANLQSAKALSTTATTLTANRGLPSETSNGISYSGESPTGATVLTR